ncbi:MAG: hypothetical protein ACUVQC_02995 [Thermaceae bacterium]
METLGPYWLRRLLLRMDPLALYEAQDARTGLPVFILQNPQGTLLEAEGVVPLLETLPEGWVLEQPRGAVPLSVYLGVADPDRLLSWGQEMRRLLRLYLEKGVRYAPRPELTLVKGRRVWFLGVGVKAFEGDPEEALKGLLLALAGEREAVLKEVAAFLSSGASEMPGLEEPPPKPEPGPVVEVVEEPPSSPPEETPLPPSRPRVIRIEERDESPPSRRGRRWGIGVLLLLFAALVLFGPFRPKGGSEGPYRVEFRLDPPGGTAELFLLEAPPASNMKTGASLGRAPSWVEFDTKGVYRIRIRVPGRDPVDYLLEVPSPPVTIKVK